MAGRAFQVDVDRLQARTEPLLGLVEEGVQGLSEARHAHPPHMSSTLKILPTRVKCPKKDAREHGI